MKATLARSEHVPSSFQTKKSELLHIPFDRL
jgi:hypothetical protein